MWTVLAAIAVLRPPDDDYTGGWTPGLVTYGALAELMGKPRRAGVTLTRQLGIIGRYAKKRTAGAQCDRGFPKVGRTRRRCRPVESDDVAEEQDGVSPSPGSHSGHRRSINFEASTSDTPIFATCSNPAGRAPPGIFWCRERLGSYLEGDHNAIE